MVLANPAAFRAAGSRAPCFAFGAVLASIAGLAVLAVLARLAGDGFFAA